MTAAEHREKIETALDRVLTELAEGDIKPNYSIDGQAVNWHSYRESLSKQARELQDLIDTMGDEDGGIVHEITQTLP